MASQSCTVSHDQGSGTIKTISLKNFMCHDNLVVNLNGGLNVITGPNGSGKSAILTGLVFALGGRAASTNRAHNFKEFIKQNRRSASVKIFICNSGSEGYKIEIYGDIIVIERKVTSSGVSTYKIMNSSGLVITRCRDEVIAILDYFNIQIENPINILNQDNSKTFLNVQDPSTKYRLFMNATNLIDVYNDYNNTKIMADKLVIKLKKKRKSSKNFKEYLDSLTSKLLLANELLNIDIRLQELKNELISRQIMDTEQNMSKLNNQVFDEQSKMEKIKKLESQSAEELKREEDEYQTLKTEITSLENEINSIGKRKQEYVTQLRQMSEAIQRKKIACYSAEMDMKNSLLTLENFQNSFQAATNHQEKLQKMNELVDDKREKTIEYEKITNKLADTKKNIDSILQNIQEKKTELNALLDDERQTKNHVNSLKQKLKSAEDTKNNRVNMFGGFTQKLLDKIDKCVQNKLFKYPPLGPVGSLLSIEDQRWLLSIENCLKEILKAYIVFDYKDRVLLQKLLKETCKANEIPMIIITSYQNSLYDYISKAPRSKYPTMLDHIQSNNHNVLNVLMDQCNIERILCIETVSDARRVMIPTPPTNAFKAYTIEGDEIISMNGRSRFYSSHQKNPRYLIENISPIIENLKEQLADTEQKYNKIREFLSKVSEPIKELENIFTKYKNEEKALQSQLKICKKELDVIEAELDTIGDIDQTSFENEILALQTRIKNLEMKFQNESNELNEMNSTYENINREYDVILSKISQYKKDWETIKENSSDKLKTVSKLTRQFNNLSELLKKSSYKINAINQKIIEMNRTIESKKSSLTAGGFIRTEKSTDTIQEEINKLEKATKTIKISPLEAERLRIEHERISRIFNEQIIKINDLKSLIKKLEEMLFIRLNDYQNLRKFVVVHAENNFQALLQYRGYDGVLKFDHEHQKLLIDVSSIGDTTISKNTRSLSGGERSFSTLSFVISLWESTDSPFRILDEFDVFMDMVNRKTSLDIIIDYTKSHPEQQIVLITPQDVTDLSESANVTVVKMDDPR